MKAAWLIAENPLRLHMAEDDQRVRRPRIITAGGACKTEPGAFSCQFGQH